MMYNNKLAIAVKANGKVLREFGETVMVPFGSEYSLLIKNLNSVRVQVRINIDGTDATDGDWLVIQPNSETELTRFIKNGNLSSGNRFKFIERTAGVEQHRGIGVEDGLIRVEYQFEHVYQSQVYYNSLLTHHNPYVSDYQTFAHNAGEVKTKSAGNRLLRSSAAGNNSVYSLSANAAVGSSVTVTTTNAVAQNDAGITVPGSVSNQQFHKSDWFPVEAAKHVMVIKLLGEVEGKVVQTPITVKAKPSCVSCGVINKATAKFCNQCGTSLIIV